MSRTALVVAALLVAPALALAPGHAAPEPLLPIGDDGPYTLVVWAHLVVAMVDWSGTPVRTWQVPGSPNTLVLDIELMQNGHLLVTVGGPTGIVGEVGGLPYEWPAHDVLVDPAGSAVYELDEDSLVVWRLTHAGGIPLTWLHDADYLDETDTFLLADTTATDAYRDRVVEVDRDGNIVWAYYPKEHAYPNDADRLANGNTLVSLRKEDRVVEIAPDGSEVWTCGAGIMKGIHQPDRLSNGNTIVVDSDNHRILEFSPACDIVWSFSGTPGRPLVWPHDADVLPNGNVLVTDTQTVPAYYRILEVTRAGDVVWLYENPTMYVAYDSDRVNVPPAITVTEPAPGSTVPSPVRFDVTAADDSLAGATYRLFDVTLGQYVDASPLPLPAAPWTRPLTSGHDYRIEVVAWDAGGEGGGFPQDDSVPESATREVGFSVA